MTALTTRFVNFVDQTIGRLGYIKATDVPRLTQLLFAGEGMRYQRDFMSQSEERIKLLAITNPWVYSNIRKIADRVALGRLMVEVQDGEGIWAEDPKHQFIKIMERTPNEYMGQMFIWTYQVIWYLLQGEAYWMQVPNLAGDKIVEVWPLPANRMEPIPSAETLFAGFEYIPTATGKPEMLAPEHVIFHRLPNPFNYNRGLSPLVAYIMGLQIDREAQKFDLEDYKQGMTLRHIISLRPEVSDPDMMRFQREIDKGAKEGKRYMVTRGGDIKAVPVTVRRGTEQGEHIRMLTKKEADYIYGIPEGLRIGSSTQANATVAERTFVSDTVWPVMVMLAEDMTVQTLARYYEENERARFEDPRLPDRELVMKEESHSWEYMTYNEVRNSKGLDEYWDPEIGKQKFAAVDKLIEMVFEIELKNSEREQALVEKESAMIEREEALLVAEVPPAEERETSPEDVGLEEEAQEPLPDAFVDEEGKGSELAYWLKSGWLPEYSTKHMAHNQLSHGRRYSGSGSKRKLSSGRDPTAIKELGTKPATKLDDIFDSAPKGSEQDFTGHLMEKMIAGEITLQEGQQLREKFAQNQGDKVPASPKVGNTPTAKRYTEAELSKGDAQVDRESWNQTLSTQEKSSLKAYSSESFDNLSTSYIDMNNHLRGKGKSPTKETREAIKQTDSALAKGVVKQDTTVFRGFPTSILGEDPSKLIGKTITDKAYVSTSLSLRVADTFGNTVAEIRVPKGAKAGFMDAVLSKADLKQLGRSREHELLLPRGSKFRILSSKKTGKRTKVVMELISE